MTETGITYNEIEWENLRLSLESQFGRKPDVQSIIFLIGHRELGQFRSKFNKGAKQDLIHVGVCTLLAKDGYYHFIARDEEGWPHFELNSSMPKLNSEEQERLLKKLILEYFKEL
jgi:hypothetical protein